MKKKMSQMDMGGMYNGMMSSDTNSAMPEPVSGYGSMSMDGIEQGKRPKPKKGSQPQRHTSPNATGRNIRNNSGGSKCYKGKCR